MIMQYFEIPPHPLLNNMIECYWVMRNKGQSSFVHRERVISDLSMEIFFNFGSPYTRNELDHASQPEVVKGSHLIGLRKKAIMISQSDKINIMAVRFKPGGLSRLLRRPLSEFTHQIVKIEEIFGSEAAILEEHLYELGTDRSRADFLDTFFLQMYYPEGSRSLYGDHRMLQFITDWIFKTSGTLPVQSICQELNIGYKKLERMFKKHIGIPPKLFCRIVRFHSTISALLMSSRSDLLQYPFYDQSHLIKEFHQFAGLSPRQFLANRLFISDQLANPDRVSNFYNT